MEKPNLKYALINKSIVLACAFINLCLITRYLNVYELGIYYSLVCIIGIQVLFDSGYCSLLVSVLSSTENKKKGLGKIGIFYYALKTFKRKAIFLFITICIYSIIIFRVSIDIDTAIIIVLLSTVVSTQFSIAPYVAFNEAEGNLNYLNNSRSYSYLVAHSLSWTTIILFDGLYFLVINRFVLLIGDIILIKYSSCDYGDNKDQGYDFDTSDNKIFKKLSKNTFIVFLCNYIVSAGLIPLSMATNGAEIAGRLGLSRAMFMAMIQITKQPLMIHRYTLGNMFQKQKISELIRFFYKKFFTSLTITLVGSILIILTIFKFEIPYISNKVPELNVLGSLFLFLLTFEICGMQSHLLRVFKIELLAIPSVVATLMILLLYTLFFQYELYTQFFILSSLVSLVILVAHQCNSIYGLTKKYGFNNNM